MKDMKMAQTLLSQVREIFPCESRFFLETSNLDLAVNELERYLSSRKYRQSVDGDTWVKECALQAIQRAHRLRCERERDGLVAHGYWAAYWTAMAVYYLALYIDVLPEDDDTARQRVDMAIHHAKAAFQNWRVWIANQ